MFREGVDWDDRDESEPEELNSPVLIEGEPETVNVGGSEVGLLLCTYH